MNRERCHCPFDIEKYCQCLFLNATIRVLFSRLEDVGYFELNSLRIHYKLTITENVQNCLQNKRRLLEFLDVILKYVPILFEATPFFC